MMQLARRWIAPLTLATAWLLFAAHELPRYGPTFDAVLGDYAYGEVMYEALLAGDRSALADPSLRLSEDPTYYGEGDHPRWKRTYPIKYVYPIPGILSAASCHLFARKLGWMNPVDAHHLIAPVSAALLSLLLFAFVRRRFGAPAAFFASAALLTHPRFVAHAMNNIKDAPTVFLVFAALYAFVRFLEDGRAWHVHVAMLLTGIGLATKINAIWPLAFFVLVFVPSRLRAALRGESVTVGVMLSFVLAPALIIGAWFACSPELWSDGFQRFADHARYVFFESVRVEGRDHFTWEPLENLLFVTPPLFLLLFPIGLIQVIRSRKLPTTVVVLLLMLLVIPIVRPCFPAMRYFNVIRHALEGIPILAIFVGVGSASVMGAIAKWAGKRGDRDLASGRSEISSVADASPGEATASTLPSRRVAVIVGALLVAPQVVANASVHPWQTAYFNWISGGLGEVQSQNRLDANDYWCHSYREGLRWINDHAEKNALVLAPVSPWMVGAVREVQLREDLGFTEDDNAVRSLIDDEGLLTDERDRDRWEAVPAVYALFPPISKRYNLPPHSEIVRFCETKREPIHTIEADGGVILVVYRILPAND